MKQMKLILLLLLGVQCTHEPLVKEDCPPGIVSFQEEILPLIQTNCGTPGCHGGIFPEDGLRLDSYASLIKKVKPNNPEDSKLYRVLFETGEDQMPPSPMGVLSAAQKSLIYYWIAQGAEKTTCHVSTCDTIGNPTFASVQQVIDLNCISCHRASNPMGNVKLDTYADVKTAATNQGLLQSLQGQYGFKQMPPSGPVSDCHRTILERWVAAGMPQ